MNDNNVENPIAGFLNVINKDNYPKKIINIFQNFIGEYGVRGTYETLRDTLNDFKASNNIDNDSITLNELVTYIQKSQFKDIFDNVDIQKAVDVFLMDSTDTNVLKNAFKTMALDIDDNVHNIYSHNHCPRIPYDEELCDVTNLMNTISHLKNMEMVVNLANFVELYYQTEEGKAFIDKFSTILSSDTHAMISFAKVMQPDLIVELSEVDLEDTHDYFNELFTTMNDYSVRQLFITDDNGVMYYKFDKKTTINGMFISFQNNKIVLNAGLTTDSHHLAEGVSPFEYAIVSKLIAEAIVNELENRCSGNLSISAMHEYWTSIDLLTHNAFMTDALINIFGKYNIIQDKDIFSQHLSNQETVRSGFLIASLKEVLLRLKSAILVNKRLGTTGVITSDKLEQFFENTETFEFRINYTSIVE